MTSLNLQYILNNLSFASLLTMVIWYWTKLIFAINPSFAIIGTIGMTIANLSLSGLLMARWVVSGHFPLSNLFESLLFLSWGFTSFHLIMERVSRADFIGIITAPAALLISSFASFSLPKEMQRTTALIPALQSNWLMMHVTVMMISYVALISGSLLSIAFLVINYYDKKKAKQSAVVQVIAEYKKKLSIGSPKGEINPYPLATPLKRELGLRRLILENTPTLPTTSEPLLLDSALLNINSNASSLPSFIPSGPAFNTSLLREQDAGKVKAGPYPLATPLKSGLEVKGRDRGTREVTQELSPLAQTLDNLSYRTLGLGFPLLTIGILSGAVWANEAWGSYWSWDPKETWAFITWLLFAIYLHTRLSKGWRGTKPAIIATLGFFVVWICYLGVNLLGTGLHSYGWFQNKG